MEKVIFDEKDFAVFTIDGLEERMKGLDTYIRPKFHALSEYFTPYLHELTKEEFIPHIAKHARRTINPPKDTWIAFSTNKRGYKMLPHFQIGLWDTHVFVWFAMIYEAPSKVAYGTKLVEQLTEIANIIPDHFVWSIDHMNPKSYQHGDLGLEELRTFATRLKQVKKAELLCGIQFSQEELSKLSKEEFYSKIEDAFKTLLPLYELAK